MCTIARTQCGYDVAQSAQTLIDCLGFFEAVFIVCRATRRKPFRSSQILYALISSAPRIEGKGKGRTTRFKQPSHASPVIRFTPLTRSVKIECDREERSFIQVVATARRDCACWRSEATWLGPVSGTVYYITKACNSAKKQYALVTTPVTAVRPLLSCLISCLRLSSSPVPSRSLIASLYCHRSHNSQLDARREPRGDIQSPKIGPPSYNPIPGPWHFPQSEIPV
jgi:hypothetical protein